MTQPLLLEQLREWQIGLSAGQSSVLITDRHSAFHHALCWNHAERLLAKPLAFNDPQRQALASVRSELWAIYDALKAYKEAPDALSAAAIEARSEKLCATRTGYASLDQALKRMRRNQKELLRVLQRPELPCITTSVSRRSATTSRNARSAARTVASRAAAAATPSPASRRPAARTVCPSGSMLRTASSAGIGLLRWRSGSSRAHRRRRPSSYMTIEAARARYCGRLFSAAKLDQIRQLIAAHPAALRAWRLGCFTLIRGRGWSGEALPPVRENIEGRLSLQDHWSTARQVDPSGWRNF